MDDFRADVKHALHMFVKNPGVTVAVVAALALGIRADTAIFSVVNSVLLKPLTYPEPDRILQILCTGPDGECPAPRRQGLRCGATGRVSFRIWPGTTQAGA